MFVAGLHSSEGSLQVGILQGSVLRPLLFSIYINDLPLCVSSADVDCDMFADDSSLAAARQSVSGVNTKLQTSLQEVLDWRSSNMMLLRPPPPKS